MTDDLDAALESMLHATGAASPWDASSTPRPAFTPRTYRDGGLALQPVTPPIAWASRKCLLNAPTCRSHNWPTLGTKNRWQSAFCSRSSPKRLLSRGRCETSCMNQRWPKDRRWLHCAVNQRGAADLSHSHFALLVLVCAGRSETKSASRS